jgi:hypothetical protein
MTPRPTLDALDALAGDDRLRKDGDATAVRKPLHSPASRDEARRIVKALTQRAGLSPDDVADLLTRREG